MIRLDSVRRSFGRVEAVRGVSFTIERGQVVGILGPNGAGKSTTIRMIAAAIPPTEGSVTVAGLDAVDHTLDVRRKIGYLPESAPVYREMRTADYLNYRAGLAGLRGRALRDAVRRTSGVTGLDPMLRRRTGTLSKGYRQRVGLAAALLHDPEVLILDEPTSGFDPAQVAETRALIRQLAGTRTTLIVSHILPEVEKSCDRIILFAGGRVRADGAPDALIRELPGAGRYTVEVRPLSDRHVAPDECFRAITAVESVDTADLESGWKRCLVAFPAGSPDQRETIARAAVAGGLLVRELRAQAATLEDVYLRLSAYAQDIAHIPAPRSTSSASTSKQAPA